MVMPSKQSVQAHSAAAQQAAATLRKEKKEPVVSDAVKAAVEAMVFEGRQRKEAAEISGIQDDSLRKALSKPDVLAYFNQCQEVLRTSARPRALRKVISLMEEASSERVSLDAAKYLDGMDRGAHQVGATVINNTQINNTLNVTPGYVLDLRPEDMGGNGVQIEHLENDEVIELETLEGVPEDE
ncbi:MAG: hypothetical protein K0M55_16010 [Rhizobium sp.]|nr:hypothetical protein [Rhizobium sp.]MBW8321987.1 hypothetical protein [Rhizobium sp.]MBW8447907.1 hypothetical protein [Arenimonas sp.]